MPHPPETKFYFAGASFDAILADMLAVKDDADRRLKIKKGDGHWFAQPCGDTIYGGDTNDSTQCPGGPLC